MQFCEAFRKRIVQDNPVCMEDGLSNPRITEGVDRSRMIVSMSLSAPKVPLEDMILDMMSKNEGDHRAIGSRIFHVQKYQGAHGEQTQG